MRTARVVGAGTGAVVTDAPPPPALSARARKHLTSMHENALAVAGFYDAHGDNDLADLKREEAEALRFLLAVCPEADRG
jgi:hypothetical protein